MRANENIRKIGVTGKTGTYFVTLPKSVIRKLKWRKGQKVTVDLSGEELVIADWKPTGK